MDIIKLSEALGGLPLAVLLIVIIIGGAMRYWVFGWVLTDMKAQCVESVVAAERRAADAVLEAKEREREWRDLARQGAQAAEQATAIAKQVKGA